MRLLMKFATGLALTGLLLLLLPCNALGQAPGDVSVAIGHMPADPAPNLTVYADQTNYLQFWIENDSEVMDMSLPFEFSWDPGLGIAFDLNYAGPGEAVKPYGDAVGAFDLIFLETKAIDGVSPDSIAFEGRGMMQGLPPHATSTFLYEMKFDASGSAPTSGWPLHFCVDNIFWPPVLEWEFGWDPPDFQGNPNSSTIDPDAPPVCFQLVERQVCGDVDCSGFVNIADAVYLITYIFGGGPAPCDPNGDEVPDC